MPPPLWREVLGARLRRMRQRRQLTLTEAAALAGISPQYLSEVERGRKDPSSEMISAITGALRLDLAHVLDLAARDLRAARGLRSLPTAAQQLAGVPSVRDLQTARELRSTGAAPATSSAPAGTRRGPVVSVFAAAA